MTGKQKTKKIYILIGLKKSKLYCKKISHKVKDDKPFEVIWSISDKVNV